MVKYNWLIFFSLPEVYFSVQFDQAGREIKTINTGKKSSLISCIYYLLKVRMNWKLGYVRTYTNKKKAKMKYKTFLLSHHLNHEQFIQV